MAYYAFLDDDNIVTEIIAGKEEGEDGVDWEQWYGDFRGQLCKRTSYNTLGGVHNDGGMPLRKNYAGIGFIYDPIRDAFLPPQPDGNYILDEASCLWVRALELGVVDNASPIIAADGVDFVMLFIAGAAADSEQEVMVNGEPLTVSVDPDGYAEFDLSSETPGLLTVEWNGFSLEVAAL